MSTLVATAEARKDIWHGEVGSQDALNVAKIIGPARAMSASMGKGDWMGSLSGGLSAGVDAVDAAIDPIAALAGSVANFLLDYMPPLPQMLDAIAGNPLAVSAQARTWYNVADRVTTTEADFRASVESALAGWTGFTADAYRSFSGALAEAIEGLGTVCQGIGGALSGASAVVAFVRSIVRDVISDLVGKLISWASQIAFTVGVGATWVIPEATTAIGIRVAKVIEWTKKLVKAIHDLLLRIKGVVETLNTSIPVFKRIAHKLEEVPLPVPAKLAARLPEHLPERLRSPGTLGDIMSPNISKTAAWANEAGKQYDESKPEAEGEHR